MGLGASISGQGSGKGSETPCGASTSRHGCGKGSGSPCGTSTFGQGSGKRSGTECGPFYEFIESDAVMAGRSGSARDMPRLPESGQSLVYRGDLRGDGKEE